MNWVNDFVGIPYGLCGRTPAFLDCYGLVKMVYLRQLGIELPDWLVEDEIDWNADRGQWVEIENPVEMCIARTKRKGNMPDHFGVVVGGGILSAQQPSSTYVTMETYLHYHPDTVFGVFNFPRGTLL